MKLLAFLFISSVVLSQSWNEAQAQESSNQTQDTWNGNLTPEPLLLDYQVAQRTPGLSDPYDVVSLRAEPVRTPPDSFEANSLK
jgi:hypothetical protein